MPNMLATPLHQVSRELAASHEWSQELGDVIPQPGILPATDYWDMLRHQVESLEMWQTTYMHALQGENAVMEWASGSSLRPYLDRLAVKLRAHARSGTATYCIFDNTALGKATLNALDVRAAVTS